MFRFAPRRTALSLKDAQVCELGPHDYLESLYVGPMVIPFIPFQEVGQKIGQQFVWHHQPELAKWSERGNDVISLKKEQEIFLAEVRMDPTTHEICPPQ